MSSSARPALLALVIASVVAVVPAGSAVAAPAGMRIVDLGTLGGAASAAVAVSSTGYAVGWAETAGGRAHAVRWDASGAIRDLGTLGGATSTATAVNAAGEVVGTAQRADGAQHAFRWTAASGMKDLGTLGGASSSAADINSAGSVVGTADLANGDEHAFVWTPGAGLTDLGTFGGTRSAASDINDAGMVAGRAAIGIYMHPFRWTPTTGMTDLVGSLGEPAAFYWAAVDMNEAGQVAGVLDGYDPSGGEGEYVFGWDPVQGLLPLSFAIRSGGYDGNTAAIDDTGRIVGTAYHAGDGYDGCWPERAFSWTSSTGTVDLGSLDGCRSWATGSALGTVVGASGNPSAPRAFVWRASTGMLDLGTLGGTQSQASAVNAAGRIVGSATTSAGARHAVMWLPGPATVVQRVTPSADTYVNRSAPRTVFGRSSSLGAGGAGASIAYLRFVVPQAPAGRVLVGVALQLRTTSLASAGTTGAVTVRSAGRAWSESSTTWLTRPSVGSTTLGSAGPVSRSSALTVRLDPRRFVAGCTVDLALLAGSDSVWFWSRQYERTSYRPVLVLTYR